MKSIKIRIFFSLLFCMGSSQWLDKVKNLPGEHYVVNNTYAFYSRYMVTVMPRYMLIDPEGELSMLMLRNHQGSAKLLLKCGVINFFVYLSMFTGSNITRCYVWFIYRS